MSVQGAVHGSLTRALLMVLAAVAALLALGCPHMHQSTLPLGASRIVTWPLENGLNGQPGKVDLLARDFLFEGEPQQQGFGYYAYLLFRSTAEQADRAAAAEALLRQARLDALLAAGAERAEMALLVAPITAGDIPTSAQALVERYDSAFAHLLVTKVLEATNERVPPVSILAYPNRVDTKSQLASDRVTIVEVCGDADAVSQQLEVFHEQLLRGELDPNSTPLRQRILDAATALGNFIRTGHVLGCPG